VCAVSDSTLFQAGGGLDVHWNLPASGSYRWDPRLKKFELLNDWNMDIRFCQSIKDEVYCLNQSNQCLIFDFRKNEYRRGPALGLPEGLAVTGFVKV
jgi:hypothetical protein